MDENDLFAELDALSSSVVKANPISETSSSAAPSTSKNIEDELFELLNSSTITPIKSDTGAPTVPVTSVDLNNEEDFLSWLEETPKKTDLKEATQAPSAPISSTEKLESIPSTSLDTAPSTSSEPSNLVAPPNPTAATPTSMDAFLDDVLGTSSSDQHHEEEVALEKKEVEAQKKKNEFEQQLEAIIDSPFPDLGFLRLVLDQGGYIPTHLRGKILIMLLTGRTQLDDEASSFSASINDKQFFIDLLPDCEALIQQESNHHAYQNSKVLVENISDVVYLYCQRRNVEYKNVFSRIMLSILGSDEEVPKPLLSSCFYSLAANFLPLVGLQYTSLDLATEAVHFWLRLLVTYHSPDLAQHLDRVVPGWEKSSREQSTQQVAKYNKLLKGANKLDQLEKEFGINMDFDFENDNLLEQETPNKKPGVLESASPKTQRQLESQRKGLIATNWIISFFSGNIPASESAKLLDWSIFNGERFAGLYFLTTLLDLHSDILLKMNAGQVTEWFEGIQRSRENWFKYCQFQILQEKETKEFSCRDLSWSQFTSGWIKATANLICNTPQAFRDSLPRTETWAVLSAERQSKALSNQFKTMLSKEKKKMNKSLLDEQLHGADDPVFDDDESDSASEDSENQAIEEEDVSSGNDGQAHKSNTVSSLFGQLKAVADRFKGDNALDASFDDSLADLSFAQDQKLTADTLCLWSSVEEVLPCICSNVRRTSENQSPKVVFQKIVTNTLDKEETQASRSQTCFFLAPLDNYTPLYFAIDCRRLAEKTLGLFPKAYSLDPEVIFDGEGLNELLAILEPMAKTTHICIIGSGAEYYKWHLSLQYKKKTKKWKKELKELIEEDSKRLNALAMILIKKAFPYISILQGGFYQAVQYINKPESKLSLNSALIDIDRFRLGSMLGLSSNESGGSGATNQNKTSILASSLATALNETAPAAIKSVGSLISNWRQSTNNSSVPPATKPATAPAADTPKLAEGAHPAPAATSDTAATAKQMFSGFGKTLGIFGASSLDTIKKGISAVAEKAAANTAPVSVSQKKAEEGEDHIDDGMGPKDAHPADDHKISITKSDQERAQALALHRMSGLKKGDQVTISRAELPGAILFPCTKIKEIWVSSLPKSAEDTKHDVAADPFEIGKSTSQDEHHEEATATSSPNEADKKETEEGEAGKVKKEIVVSRYLVVSRERFMVLDANGGGVGSIATVKSNHHLTELTKMTFRKKDPELVSLFILGDDGNVKTRKYRVTKYQDFINTLQKHMERFK